MNRSSLYYTPADCATQDALNKYHMDAIDEIYTDYPFYGTRRMKGALIDNYDIYIDRLRIAHLMKRLGLQAIYPKPRTSIPDTQHKKYPYLLRNITARYPNHIWGTDITYIRIQHGFAYLMALIDWYSRFVLSWCLSPTLETAFCIDALHCALSIATPKFHNSDQGSQFTDVSDTNVLIDSDVAISMDGKGRYLDNIFTERLWRSVKYENVYLADYATLSQADEGLAEYFNFYNNERRHQSLENRTPVSMYYG